MNIPPAEVEHDYAETKKDIAHLEAVTQHLRAFITETDEVRDHFKLDLMKYETLLSQARLLLAKIESFRANPGATAETVCCVCGYKRGDHFAKGLHCPSSLQAHGVPLETVFKS